jgi:segregation and condensation protein A
MPVAVHTPVFEGPFDLLLHLILREQVDLYEVSLTAIVDAYLSALDDLETLDLEIATEFLLIAATLVELKARRLLPGLDDGELDDELGLWEERDLLLARLLECKTFKDAAAVLSQLHDQAGQSYARRAGPDERYIDLTPDSLTGVTPLQLRAAFIRAATPRPQPTLDLFHVAPIRVSVVEAVDELLDELPRIGRITFRGLTEALVGKLEIVVRFLAVLELFKQGLIDLEQTASFGDIEIVWTGGDQRTSADLALVDLYEG